MDTWLEFLTANGGEIDDTVIASFGEQPEHFPDFSSRDTLSPLTDRGVISITGADTNSFLQGQLTCDINKLETGQAMPGALCEVKGRMISSFYAFRPEAETVLLIMHEGVVAKTTETLQKYVPFYRGASLSDVSDRYRVLGVNRNGTVHEECWRVSISESRSLLLVPSEHAENLWRELSSQCKPTGVAYWQYLTIADGLGEVRPETCGEFIPQMLNLQHLGAISFRKGCYTGQEIVARMQYLGKLKRRMYRLAIAASAAPDPGTAVHTTAKANIGTVVMAQRTGASEVQLLAVLTTESTDNDRLVFGETEAAVTILPLPYDDKFETGQ